MKIGHVDLDERVLVVAEIGNNHEGDVGVARELVDRAAAAGADAVKFQTFVTDRFVSRADTERHERMRRFEFTPGQFAELAELARERGLCFLSTPLDLESADVLEPLVDAFKIASGDNTFYPLIDRVSASEKPVVVSAGLAELDEIAAVAARIRGRGAELAVLHAVSSYPTAPEEAGLRAIEALRAKLDCVVGYSDHTIGLDAAPLAVALGARIVEKHFTLDKRTSTFRDHALSADPDDLAALVERIRTAETLLGAPGKRVQPSERQVVEALRRSIVAAGDLPRGHRVATKDLMWLRPGGGLAPGEEERLVGRRLVRAVEFGERLSPQDVE